jgi:hypothetical protein
MTLIAIAVKTLIWWMDSERYLIYISDGVFYLINDTKLEKIFFFTIFRTVVDLCLDRHDIVL